jgi:hypothetical protein
MKFKLFAAVAAVVLVTGCSTAHKTAWEVNVPAKEAVAPTVIVNMPKPVETDTYKLQNYKGPEAMDSNELAMHSRECVLSKLRPRVTYVSVRAEAGKILVPVSVNCEPYIQ